jgi:hypothetical protein
MTYAGVGVGAVVGFTGYEEVGIPQDCLSELNSSGDQLSPVSKGSSISSCTVFM